MRRLLPLLLAPLLAGCPGAEGAQCVGDDECAQGLACFAGTCAPLGEPAGSLALYVAPPASSGYLPAAFPLSGNRVQLSLCDAAEIRGSVAVEGITRVQVEGALAGIPGSELGYEEAVEGPFALRLPPGTWKLTFELPADPEGLAPPPIVREVELPRCQAVELEPVEPPLPLRAARLIPVVDELRDPRPRCGVAVSLADAETGQALSRRLGIEAGPDLACSAPAEGWTLLFSDPESGRLAVKLEPLDPQRPSFATREIVYDVTAPGVVDLGMVGIGGAPLERVLLRVADGAGAPVRRAVIRMETAPVDPLQLPAETKPPTFRAGAALEVEPGLYELWAVPGTYRFEVIPPADAGLSLQRCVSFAGGGTCGEELAIEAAAELEAILPPPIRLSGQVSDAEGPVPEARVTALPARDGGGREATALTGPRGRYELRVDPGDYDLVVQPHDGGRALLRQPLAAPVAAESVQHLVLPPPARIVGNVTTRGEGVLLPLERALVRAYRLRDDGPPEVVGEGVTDASGRFTLVLPGAD